MRWLTTIFFGILIGAGLTYTGFYYHVVRANEGHLMVPKKNADLSDVYVDIRKWGVADWQKHPQLSQAVVAHGRSDLVVKPAAENMWNGVLNAIDNAILDRRDTRTK